MVEALVKSLVAEPSRQMGEHQGEVVGWWNKTWKRWLVDSPNSPLFPLFSILFHSFGCLSFKVPPSDFWLDSKHVFIRKVLKFIEKSSLNVAVVEGCKTENTLILLVVQKFYICWQVYIIAYIGYPIIYVRCYTNPRWLTGFPACFPASVEDFEIIRVVGVGGPRAEQICSGGL